MNQEYTHSVGKMFTMQTQSTIEFSFVTHSTNYKTAGILKERSVPKNSKECYYEGWNFNFGNIPLDWIQELLE